MIFNNWYNHIMGLIYQTIKLFVFINNYEHKSLNLAQTYINVTYIYIFSNISISVNTDPVYM